MTLKSRQNPKSCPPVLSTVQWLVLSGCFIYFCLSTIPHAWNKLDTDFPNYYLTARLARDGFDPSRIYEWR